ncbi:MAG: cytochrome B5 [Candidatus Bathyarchaeota archaeon]|nr:cytochrome B5 [Candidatus Bathyarchaeota archaeon]
MAKITKQELEENNGQNGKPAWVAVEGKVYDVTESSFWADGSHMGMHDAGKDLTDDLSMAPHGADNMEKVKYVGDLE